MEFGYAYTRRGDTHANQVAGIATILSNLNADIPDDYDDGEKRLVRVARMLDKRIDEFPKLKVRVIRRGHLSTKKGLQELHTILLAIENYRRVANGQLDLSELTIPLNRDGSRPYDRHGCRVWEGRYRKEVLELVQAATENSRYTPDGQGKK